MITVRPAETDADFEVWLHVRRVVLPNESAGSVELLRERATPDRLLLLAELDGELAGSGLGDRSDAAGRAFVAPRVLPDARRRGIGTELLRRLAEHAAGLGLPRVGSHVDDEGSRAFAERFGFEEIDRQVEQVWRPNSARHGKDAPEGVEVVTIAERPELLEAAYPLGRDGWADFATVEAVSIAKEDWLRDEATLPAGSFVALSGTEIVGFSGLCKHDQEGIAEDGLTVVRRDWRGRGLAQALKERELAWAAENGYREVITWTQKGNDAMQALNERLGYSYRGVTSTMVAPVPLGFNGS